MERLYLAPDSMFSTNFPGWGSFLGTGRPFKVQRTYEDWIEISERLAFENNGVLPGKRHLRDNGYSGLTQAMARRPELFTHIVQEKIRKSVLEWVTIAESLAIKHDGVLPCGSWLCKHKLTGLDYAIRKHPDAFRHILQAKPIAHHKSPGEWVLVAKELANHYKGILPCGAWLKANGYYGLDQAMHRNPKLFDHIKKERRDPHGRIINQGEAV